MALEAMNPACESLDRFEEKIVLNAWKGRLITVGPQIQCHRLAT